MIKNLLSKTINHLKKAAVSSPKQNKKFSIKENLFAERNGCFQLSQENEN
jgi:hypothetical protein